MTTPSRGCIAQARRRAPRAVAICFFGLNRSLKWTAESIQRKVLDRLAANCVPYRVFVHTYSVTHAPTNARAHEGGQALGGPEEIRRLLRPEEMEVTNQDDYAVEISRYLPLEKGSHYRNYTARNLLCQLYSIVRVTRLWLAHVHELHAVVYMRPDLKVLRPLDVVAVMGARFGEFYSPYWHSWHGLNDRFAFARPMEALAFGLRLARLREFVSVAPLQAERFLKFAVQRANLTVRPTSSVSVRIRADGHMEPLDRSLNKCAFAGEQCHGPLHKARIPSAVRLETIPEQCRDVPDYGQRRRRVLIACWGSVDNLATTGPSFRTAVVQTLEQHCIQWKTVAIVWAPPNEARANVANSMRHRYTAALEAHLGVRRGDTLIDTEFLALRSRGAPPGTSVLQRTANYLSKALHNHFRPFAARFVIIVHMASIVIRPIDVVGLMSARVGMLYRSELVAFADERFSGLLYGDWTTVQAMLSAPTAPAPKRLSYSARRVRHISKLAINGTVLVCQQFLPSGLTGFA